MICSGCLQVQEAEGYCKKCLNDLFDGKKVSHMLSFNSPYKEESSLYTNLIQKLSISGVQIKYSMKLEEDTLILADRGGQYILKPIPSGQFKNLDQVPANEHLTMQIARQCFKIDVPGNAIVNFKDGSPAYLVRRFDVKPDGSKFQQEDFAQLAQITEVTHGKNYKYDLSYEEIGTLISKHIAMYPIEVEKFFRLVLFNYIFSNGDAHVKNFSIIQSNTGDFVLTPAYDLLCTRLQFPGEADMALILFKGISSPAFDAYGFYTYNDFLSFGKTIGMKESRVVKIIDEFMNEQDEVLKLIMNSFLRRNIKEQYKEFYRDKMSRLRMKMI